MPHLLWKASWKGNQLLLTSIGGELCLEAHKGGKVLHKWCVDIDLSTKLSQSLGNVLSGTLIGYVYPKEDVPFCLTIEKIVSSFCFFEFCKGNNINKGENCLFVITHKTHLRRLQNILSNVKV